MLTDRYDLPLSTTSIAARDAYVQGCEAKLTMYPGAIEAFGIVLARHFAEAAQVSSATVSIAEHAWRHLIGPGGTVAPDAFRRSGAATRTATVVANAAGMK